MGMYVSWGCKRKAKRFNRSATLDEISSFLLARKVDEMKWPPNDENKSGAKRKITRTAKKKRSHETADRFSRIKE